ncbi:hypothetical protein [Salipiger bermudensis]|nr:hypothetical protein [Salipiger bermudensis]
MSFRFSILLLAGLIALAAAFVPLRKSASAPEPLPRAVALRL